MKSITSLYNAFRIRKRKQLMKSHQNPIFDRFCRLEGVDKENSLGTNFDGWFSEGEYRKRPKLIKHINEEWEV